MLNFNDVWEFNLQENVLKFHYEVVYKFYQPEDLILVCVWIKISKCASFTQLHLFSAGHLLLAVKVFEHLYAQKFAQGQGPHSKGI